MKKTLSILLTVLSIATGAFAQNILVKNNTAAVCGAMTVVLYANDQNNSCGTFISNSFTVAGGGTVWSRTGPTDVNDPLCTPSGSGPGWTSSYCMSGIPSIYEMFNGADVTIGGSTYQVGIACFTASFTATGTDCQGNTVYIDYACPLPSLHTLTVHY